MAIVRNLATVKTTASITSSATSIPVNRTSVFGASQNPLDNPFYVTIMPASGTEPANLTNSEIALVTGISGTNLIVTRGQRSTTAKAFNSGAIVTNGIYAEDAVLLGDGGTAVGTPAPWVDTSDVKNGAITTDKIADGAVKSAKIDFATFLNNVFTYSGTRTTTGTFTTVPAGKYLLVWHARFATSETQAWANVVISHGSTSLPIHTASCFVVNDGHTPVVGQSAVITASSNEAIALQSISTSGSIFLQSCNLSIFGIKS